MDKPGRNRRNEQAILTLARNIRKYRKANHITIMELSALLNVDYSQIGRMERGVVNPTISVIFDVAAALNIRPGQLLEE